MQNKKRRSFIFGLLGVFIGLLATYFYSIKGIEDDQWAVVFIFMLPFVLGPILLLLIFLDEWLLHKEMGEKLKSHIVIPAGLSVAWLALLIYLYIQRI